MARVDVVMPQMGESIAEGTLSKWLKKVGDQVKRDEPIFEISTDKVDAEIPAPTSGVLAEILVTEGQTVAGADGGRAPRDDVNAAVAAPAPQPRRRRSRRRSGAAPAPSSRRVGRPRHPPAAPAQPRAAHGNGELARGSAAHQVVAARSANGGRARRRDQRAAGLRHCGPRHQEGSARLPRVRRARRRRRAPARRPLRRPSAHGPLPEPWAGDVVEPMSKMRALIAEHMVVSRHTSAHVSSIFEVDFTRVARIRAKNRAEFERRPGEKLTYMPFIIKAVVDGLKAHPGAERGGARQRDHLPQADQHRHRGRARLGAHRPGHQERRQPVAHRAYEIAQRPRQSRAQQEARSARSAGRHVHDHEPRRVRLADRHADHQPAAGRHPLHRRASRSGRR